MVSENDHDWYLICCMAFSHCCGCNSIFSCFSLRTKLESLQNAFDALRELAVANGAPDTIELLQARESDKILLIGSPGVLEEVKEGTFPPPPPPKKDDNEEY